MTFVEFLTAMGESRYRKLLEGVDSCIPLSEGFHLHLIDMLRRYYFVGGMPEAVKHFSEAGNGWEIREIQQEIINPMSWTLPSMPRQLTCPNLSKFGIPFQGIWQKRTKNSYFLLSEKGSGRVDMKMH